jgi:hypothetical protein
VSSGVPALVRNWPIDVVVVFDLILVEIFVIFLRMLRTKKMQGTPVTRPLRDMEISYSYPSSPIGWASQARLQHHPTRLVVAIFPLAFPLLALHPIHVAAKTVPGFWV